MRRRSLLVGLAAGLAGCNSGRESGPTPTATPLSVPGDDEAGRPDGPLAIEESRFDPETPAPSGVRLFHRLDANYDIGIVPNRETFTPARPAAPVRLRNRRREPLFVASGWSLRKYTGHRWVRILGTSPDRGGVRLEAESEWRQRHRIRNVFDLPVLGPGLYARLRTVRVPDGTTGGEAITVGMLFEVEGTDYEMTPVRVPQRNGDTARLVTSQYAERSIVFERIEGTDPRAAEPLVPEAVGALEVFRDSLPVLESVPEVEVFTSVAPRVFDLLAATTRRAVPVGPGTRLSLDGTIFTARITRP